MGAQGPTAQPLQHTLLLLGDVMLGRQVDLGLSHWGPAAASRVWGNMLIVLQGTERPGCPAPLVAGNLETTVTGEDSRPVPGKAFNFRMSPLNMEALRSAGFQFCALANNHCLDYGQAGLEDTQQALERAGISHAGTGLVDDAARPAVVQHGSLKVAFLSYSDHFEDWQATDAVPGINYIDPANHSAAALRRAVEGARAAAAGAQPAAAVTVVVMVHWGPNWAWEPSNAIRKLGRAFIDAGADVVFGTSPHHIQGVEVYQSRPIVYGAGGAIDDYALDEAYRNDLGFMFRVCLCGSGVPQRLELLPIQIRHEWLPPGTTARYLCSVHAAEGPERQWVCRKMQELSSAFGTKVQEQEPGLHIELGSKE